MTIFNLRNNKKKGSCSVSPNPGTQHPTESALEGLKLIAEPSSNNTANFGSMDVKNTTL